MLQRNKLDRWCSAYFNRHGLTRVALLAVSQSKVLFSFIFLNNIRGFKWMVGANALAYFVYYSDEKVL
jgi:hypothetical protein